MRDLNEVLDLTLHLPINGKVYKVDPPPAAVGADLQNKLAMGIVADAGFELTDEERGAIIVGDEDMPDFGRACLGSVIDEMHADGLDRQRIEFAVETAFLAWTVSKEFAETFWESGGKVEGAPSPRQMVTPTPMGAGSMTQKRKSQNGTSSRRAKPRAAKGSRSRSSGAGTGT